MDSRISLRPQQIEFEELEVVWNVEAEKISTDVYVAKCFTKEAYFKSVFSVSRKNQLRKLTSIGL